MRCDKCKFWDRESGKEYAGGVGECTKAKPFWDCSRWQDDDEGYRRVMLPECADMKMFVQDGSDYRAHLLTRPDFFCAEFKALSPQS